MTTLLDVWRLLWRRLHLRFGRRVWLWAALVLVAPLTEALSVFLILPLFQAIGLRTAGEAPSEIALLTWLGLRLKSDLLSVLALLLGAILLHEVVTWYRSRTLARFELKFVAGLRNDLFRSMALTRWAAVGRMKTATLHKTITEDVERSARALAAIENLCLSVLITVSYLAMAVWVAPILTALVGCGSATYLVLVRKPIARMEGLGRRVAEVYGDFYRTITDYLTFIRTFKSYGKVDDAVARFEAASGEIADIHISEVDIRANLELLYKVAGALGLCGLFYVTLGVVRVPASSFFFLALVLSRVALRVPVLIGDAVAVTASAPSLREAFAVIETLSAEQEVSHVTDRLRALSTSIDLRFDRVSFAYDPGTPVLSALSLHFSRRQTTALVGASGSGKSTILDLLVGLLEPQAGQILIDGQQASTADLIALRRLSAYVGQEMFLFHGTVRENLLWGAEAATEPEIEQALEATRATDFVRRLPLGLETIVGDRGVLLSGGQRQRLAIARALLRKPVLLILDEPTSALDTETENQIVQTLESLKGTTTIALVSHRLNAIRCADVVYGLQDGVARVLGPGPEVIERSRLQLL
jgi:ATP-binding cassette subfamily C protein